MTVKPLPYTQIQITDFQVDGTIAFRSIIQAANKSARPLTTTRFINSDFVNVTKMSPRKRLTGTVPICSLVATSATMATA